MDREPEVDGFEPIVDGILTGNVRIVLPCVECGNELKEYTFEVEMEDSALTFSEHEGDGCNLTAGAIAEPNMKTEGGGRYMKTFYGYALGYKVSCSCGGFEVEGNRADFVQASSMEELV